MSDPVKFSFEGDPAVLAQLLQVLSRAGEPGVVGPSAPPIVPRSVQDQQPPSSSRKITIPSRPPSRRHVRPPAPPTPSTMEPLQTDPVYPGPAAQGPGSSLVPSNPAPSLYAPGSGFDEPGGFDWGSMALEDEAWTVFVDFLAAWIVGYDSPVDEDGNPTEEQPDRLELLKGLGSGRWPLPVMRWVAEYGSLQAAIHKALGEDDLDRVGSLASNITQVAHAAFPDIVAFYDHSTKWKRKIQESAS